MPRSCKAQPLAAAEIEIAVCQMQVAVADAGRQNLQQHLAAGRLWRGLFVELQRLAANADLEHAHCYFSPGTIFVMAFVGHPARQEPHSAPAVSHRAAHGANCLPKCREICGLQKYLSAGGDLTPRLRYPDGLWPRSPSITTPARRPNAPPGLGRSDRRTRASPPNWKSSPRATPAASANCARRWRSG